MLLFETLKIKKSDFLNSNTSITRASTRNFTVYENCHVFAIAFKADQFKRDFMTKEKSFCLLFLLYISNENYLLKDPP